MSKIIVFISFVVICCLAIFVWVMAQETNQASSTASSTETITAADLGVSNPGILPSSPFYFLKEWGRSIREFFTFNPIKKAELELQYTNDRAAEIEKIVSVASSSVEAITKATDNYDQNVERLKNSLETLKETSQNPNVDQLLNNLVDRSLQHQQLFENLKTKFENRPQLEQALTNGQEKVNEMISEIPKKFEGTTISSSTEKLKKRIEDWIGKEPGGKACTQEAKICPNGSSVGRTGQNCEFAPCPTSTNKLPQ